MRIALDFSICLPQFGESTVACGFGVQVWVRLLDWVPLAFEDWTPYSQWRIQYERGRTLLTSSDTHKMECVLILLVECHRNALAGSVLLCLRPIPFFCTCKNWKITDMFVSGVEFYSAFLLKKKVLSSISLYNCSMSLKANNFRLGKWSRGILFLIG